MVETDPIQAKNIQKSPKIPFSIVNCVIPIPEKSILRSFRNSMHSYIHWRRKGFPRCPDRLGRSFPLTMIRLRSSLAKIGSCDPYQDPVPRYHGYHSWMSALFWNTNLNMNPIYVIYHQHRNEARVANGLSSTPLKHASFRPEVPKLRWSLLPGFLLRYTVYLHIIFDIYHISNIWYVICHI